MIARTVFHLLECNLHVCLLPVRKDRLVNESRHHCEKNGQADKIIKRA